MKMKSTFAIASLGILFTLSGCTKRTIVAFEDQPKQPFTAVEVIEEKNYFFSHTVEHRFVMCKDGGNALQCSRSCGGPKEIECPKGALTSLARGTNVR